MIKGPIQSQVIDDVQSERYQSDSNTIQRILAVDRNTDIGRIQVGDRYHACVASKDLRPPEGFECEKRVIKYLEKVNSLSAIRSMDKNKTNKIYDNMLFFASRVG